MSEPQATLDYHGQGILRKEQILSVCEEFIKNAKKNKYSRILIITGKGLHSGGDPVIKPLVFEFLQEKFELEEIEKFVEARRDRGGSGAFEVWMLKDK